MDIGIDIGASSTKVVAIRDGTLEFKEISDERDVEAIVRDVKERLQLLDIGNRQLFITGGNPSRLKGFKDRYIDEISAIGSGGCYLSGRDKCLVVNAGTGVCSVYFGGKAEHLGGSGIGGGTLTGLGQAMLGTDDFTKLEEMASRGDLSKVDLNVGDVVGDGIGVIPGSATASHFARMKNPNKYDLARGLFNMVAQNIAIIGVSNSKWKMKDDIVFTGRLITCNMIKSKIREVCGFFGKKAVFPVTPEFSSAIGAVVFGGCRR